MSFFDRLKKMDPTFDDTPDPIEEMEVSGLLPINTNGPAPTTANEWLEVADHCDYIVTQMELLPAHALYKDTRDTVRRAFRLLKEFADVHAPREAKNCRRKNHDTDLDWDTPF